MLYIHQKTESVSHASVHRAREKTDGSHLWVSQKGRWWLKKNVKVWSWLEKKSDI